MTYMNRFFHSDFGRFLTVSRQKMASLSSYDFILYSFMLSLTLTSCSMPDGPEIGDASTLPTTVETTTETATDEPEIMPPEITMNGPGQLLPITAIAQMGSEQISLEVAQTPQQQALGLMFRSALPDDRGMFFPLGNPRRARFWMKNVPVPLDMVFLRDSEIVFIASEVPPCATLPCPSYGPETELVNQVIELRSGRAAEIGLQPGDTVLIQSNLPKDL